MELVPYLLQLAIAPPHFADSFRPLSRIVDAAAVAPVVLLRIPADLVGILALADAGFRSPEAADCLAVGNTLELGNCRCSLEILEKRIGTAGCPLLRRCRPLLVMMMVRGWVGREEMVLGMSVSGWKVFCMMIVRRIRGMFVRQGIRCWRIGRLPLCGVCRGSFPMCASMATGGGMFVEPESL